MREHTIQCGGLTLVAKQGVGGWSSIVHGARERHVAIKADEDAAKKACLEIATAIHRRLGGSIPDCLKNPRWD